LFTILGNNGIFQSSLKENSELSLPTNVKRLNNKIAKNITGIMKGIEKKKFETKLFIQTE
jgi:hypothetical protein